MENGQGNRTNVCPGKPTLGIASGRSEAARGMAESSASELFSFVLIAYIGLSHWKCLRVLIRIWHSPTGWSSLEISMIRHGRRNLGGIGRREETCLSVILISVNEKPSTVDGISVWARRENCRGQKISQIFAKLDDTWKSKPVADKNKQSPTVMNRCWKEKFGEIRDLSSMTLIAQFFQLIWKPRSDGNPIWRLWLQLFPDSQLN